MSNYFSKIITKSRIDDIKKRYIDSLIKTP